VESAVKMSAAIGKVSSYAAPVFAAIVFLIVASVLLLAFRLFGGEGTFRQAFSATLYAWTPSIILNIIFLIVVLARGGDIDVTQIQSVVRSNPSFLVDPKAHALLFTLLASLDAFGIWTMVLMIFGFSALSRMSRAKAASIIIPLWLVKVLFSLIPAAMRSMR
jgi:hypothetical protein